MSLNVISEYRSVNIDIRQYPEGWLRNAEILQKVHHNEQGAATDYLILNSGHSSPSISPQRGHRNLYG